MSLKAEVPASAGIRRLNRQLKPVGLAVRKSRGIVADQLGDYFVVSGSKVTQPDVDLEFIACKHGVLEPFEAVSA